MDCFNFLFATLADMVALVPGLVSWEDIRMLMFALSSKHSFL